jgi:hypothetical protein
LPDSHSRWLLLLFVAGLAAGIAVVLRQLAYKVNPSSAGKRRNHLLRRNTDRRRRAQPGRNTWPGGQREFRDQEYEVRSAAEAMPDDKWI